MAEVSNDRRPILLTVGNHTQRPLWKDLGVTFRLAFANDQFADEAKSLGVAGVLSMKDYSGAADVEKAKGQAILLAGDIAEDIKDGHLTLDDSVASMSGLNLLGWLPTFVYEQTAPVVAHISACATLHETERIAGILLHEDVTPTAKALAAWGNTVGVPTLHQPHGNHFFKPTPLDVHCRVTARHLGVRGGYMRDWYKACGATNITEIGAPIWDELYDPNRLPTRDSARRALGIKPEEYVLQYGTTWYQLTSVWGDDPENYLDSCLNLVVEAAQALGAFLLISMHPGETPGQENHYAASIKKAGLRGAVTRTHNSHCLRAANCLVIQGPSNLGVKACILGTPVVELYQHGARYPDYGPKGTWGEGLLDLIKLAIVPEGFAEAMNYKNDGKSTERAVEWVRSTCLSQ